MRSPADMQTIQIDITNACNKRCSNCTRFCGNHNKNFFMDFETFERAVNSLDGYNGVIGIMGGEPTLHPEFERFVRFIQEKFGVHKEENRMIYPQREFIREVRRREFESHVLREGEDGTGQNSGWGNFKMCGPGLWSNMGVTYSKYYELIQDTFNVQFLNDHINPSYHQPGLFARKDLNIPDEEWIELRDKCWIQNEWSASITPKGAFFCEIAGALDMLFDGPGGWPIESGWWKRTPKEFGEQLHWCEICGFALDTFMRDAEEEIDDVSPTLYEMLKKVDSLRLKQGRINLVKIQDGVIAENSKASNKHLSTALPYIENYEDRFNQSNSQLFVKEYSIVSIPEGASFGQSLNRELAKAKDWILFMDAKKVTGTEESCKAQVDALIKEYVLNPGTLHKGAGFVLFSKNALSLRELGYDRIAHVESFDDIERAWMSRKIVYLKDVDELVKWKRESIIAGKKYVIWGTGLAGSFIADAVTSSGGNLLFAIDSDRAKDNDEFYDVMIHCPEYLRERIDEFDYLLIGHYSRYEEIYRQAVAMGISEEKIMRPYEV